MPAPPFTLNKQPATFCFMMPTNPGCDSPADQSFFSEGFKKDDVKNKKPYGLATTLTPFEAYGSKWDRSYFLGMKFNRAIKFSYYVSQWTITCTGQIHSLETTKEVVNKSLTNDVGFYYERDGRGVYTDEDQIFTGGTFPSTPCGLGTMVVSGTPPFYRHAGIPYRYGSGSRTFAGTWYVYISWNFGIYNSIRNRMENNDIWAYEGYYPHYSNDSVHDPDSLLFGSGILTEAGTPEYEPKVFFPCGVSMYYRGVSSTTWEFVSLASANRAIPSRKGAGVYSLIDPSTPYTNLLFPDIGGDPYGFAYGAPFTVGDEVAWFNDDFGPDYGWNYYRPVLGYYRLKLPVSTNDYSWESGGGDGSGGTLTFENGEGDSASTTIYMSPSGHVGYSGLPYAGNGSKLNDVGYRRPDQPGVGTLLDELAPDAPGMYLQENNHDPITISIAPTAWYPDTQFLWPASEATSDPGTDFTVAFTG